ncbi:hypothetical protein OIO90_003204 [Microbotryomycetes sp. JL221]|nr:hypothetical protein OIO90_003204 [Microbotryomycetes sp. JL221]
MTGQRSRSSTITSTREILRPDESPLQTTNVRALPSTTTTTIKTDDVRATTTVPAELNHWTRSRDESELATSYGSQLTLKTIRGTDEDDDDDDQDEQLRATSRHDEDEPKRGSPHFILDLNSKPTLSSLSNINTNTTRDRSATFGGVPLPDSPQLDDIRRQSLQQQQQHSDNKASTSRTDTRRPSRPSPLVRSNSSSSSLHLGGPRHPIVQRWSRLERKKPMLAAGIKAGTLFLTSLLVLWIVLKSLLPPIDEEHKQAVKLPKSFDDLKQLNEVLQIYKERHYSRVLGSFVTVYLFIQAFSIPGSMYMSILGGAMYGVVMALPLVCFCVASGALLCYFISAALGPAILLNSEKWQKRIEAWTDRVRDHQENLVSYLIVLRIAPLPPHWVVNVVAPHLGISIWHFWISTFFGIAGVSYIHTTIGTTLDQMTSSNDFHLLSWQNGLGLGGIVVAVLIPVGLRRMYRKDLEQAAQDPTQDEQDEVVHDIGSSSRRPSSRSGVDEPLLPSTTSDISIRPPPGTERGIARQSSKRSDRPFTLLSDDDDDSNSDRDDDDARGPSSTWTRNGDEAVSRGGGDSDKASRVLGVDVRNGSPRF